MTLRRVNRRKGDNNNDVHQQQQQQQAQRQGKPHTSASKNLAQPSDYESDIPEDDDDYLAELNYTNDGDLMASQAGESQLRLPSNEAMNLMVLKRHDPAIATILSIAPHAVVYLFNPTTQLWEKENVGIEGTLFICQLTQGELGEDRYSVIILNRRGLQNFETQLFDGEDVKITEDYVILRVVDGRARGSHDASSFENKGVASRKQESIYGLWIFSEPAPSSTAETRALNSQAIKEFATLGAQSRKAAEERRSQRQSAPRQEAAEDGGQRTASSGRQVSLQELFEQQRTQDAHGGVHAQSQLQTAVHPTAIAPPNASTIDSQDKTGGDVLGDLFRKAGMTYQNPR